MEERYTDIRLVKVPIEIDNKNQLDFSSATTQYNYFNSCDYIELDNSSYQRKDNSVRYPGHIDDLIGYNYCMYKNSSYSNKWFYAFITDMQYVNDSMTLVSIKTDVWQSWQFDIEIKKCFVEREHVNDDTVGVNTVPEGLETGEYIVEGVESSTPGTSHLVIAATYDAFNNVECGDYYNGIYSGVNYFLIASAGNPSDASFSSSIRYFMGVYATATKSDSITGLFLVPDEISGYNYIDTNHLWDYMYEPDGLGYYPYKKLTSSVLSAAGITTTAIFDDVSINKPYNSIDSYVPKNNKLFTYPYKYLRGTNNSGASAIYHYELFGANPFVFKTKGAISPGCSIKSYPYNYKGTNDNYDEGLNFGKFPICSYSTDMYTNWLTQNAINIPLKIVGSVISAGAGAITGNPIGVASGILGVASTVGEVYEHSLVPPQAEGNLNNGDVNYSMNINKVMFYKMSIRQEYARIIDEFFSMFGYKVNRVKIPNITGRTNWNYVKTIDCNIHGYIPQKDCVEIKNMLNNGVTFWHNPLTFLDYSQSNTIVNGS